MLAELHWVCDRAAEHLGDERAGRYLRKFYPWYLERMALPRPALKRVQEELQRLETLAGARARLDALAAEDAGSHRERRATTPALSGAR